MSRDIWNPRQYRAYASHRARPFYELLARVDVEAPAYVVDLGCGPGERTVDLTVRWPGAVIEGIDSSVQMITEARLMAAERTSHRRGSFPPEAGPTATGDSEVPEAEVSPNPASQAPAASPGTAVSEPGLSPDTSVTGASAASPGMSAAAAADRGGESGSSAYVAGSSGGEALGVAEGVRPPAGSGTSPDFAAAARAAAGGGSRGRPGGAVSTGGSSGLPEVDQGGGELRFSVGDLAGWTPDRPVDVIFSNAAFQWVPEHRELLPRWVEALAPGGRLAFSMPGNFDAPSHRILRELCESPRWRDRLGKVNRHNVVGDPADYFELLSGLGCEVDAWETTYVQVLHGADPVLEWMKGTALRPAFDALPDDTEREEFVTELAALLREAYPRGPHGTLFPFRRVFVIAGPAKSASA